MTTDLYMLAWTCGLTIILAFPYVTSHVLKHGIVDALTYKADSEPLSAWAARAKKAHYNAIENLAPFAGLVIVAHLSGNANAATAAACIAYFWSRVAHYILYATNIPFGRTLAFVVGWLAMACIFWQIIT
jgi:uncharacterized MAPEG superfamily protein